MFFFFLFRDSINAKGCYFFRTSSPCYAANAELSGTFNGNVVFRAAGITLDSTTVIAPEKEREERNEKIGEFAAAVAVVAWFLQCREHLYRSIKTNRA